MRLRAFQSNTLLVARTFFISFFFAMALCAQQPSPRLATEIDDSDRVTLPGSHPPMAKTENDAGQLPSGTMLHGISVVLSRSAAQESDLQALITAQQTPGPLYHKWLSPEEFAARFGVADSDISVI